MWKYLKKMKLGLPSQLCVLVVVFQLSICLAEKHMILHLGIAVDEIYTVDGATVVSSYNKTHPFHAQWIMLMPPKHEQIFIIQFEYLDVPCPERLTVTEVDISLGIISATVGNKVLDNFCGTVDDLFPVNRFSPSEHFIKTKRPGYALNIMWSSKSKAAITSQGLRLLVTASTPISDCPENRFSCRQMCISKDLVCDGFPHCLDHSDESGNCTQLLHKIDSLPLCLPSPCGEAGLQWQFHHNTFTLMVPMVLALIFISVAILWRYKRIIRRLLHDNHPLPRSAISFDSSEIATAEHETFYNVEMPEICLRDAVVFNPDWHLHEPPPYSPRQDTGPVSYLCDGEGDSPPPYEEVIQEDRAISETATTKPAAEPLRQTNTDTG